MAEIQLSPFRGIDNVADERALGKGFFVDAVNVDIDEEGHAARRRGRILSLAGTGFHSLWSSPMGAFCMQGNRLFRAQVDGSAVVTTELAVLPTAEPASFTALNDGVVVANRSYLGMISPDFSVRRLGVSRPSAPALTANAAGGLAGGRYSVALTFLRGGEESGLSELSTVTVPDGSGISVAMPSPSDPTITGIRIYRTGQNGDVLYRAADAAVGLPSFLLGNAQLGRAADTQFLDAMPGGHIARYWRGRLLVARDSVLYMSEPMRYGLCSPRHGFVQFHGKITMLEPVEGGVFVGTKHGVQFLSGPTPGEWSMVQTSSAPPIAGASSVIPANLIRDDFGAGGQFVAVWLSTKGYVLGLNTGQILEPQSKRIRLNGQAGHLAVHDRRIIATLS